MESELRENIKNFLLNHDLCSMCIQRFLGERQHEAYCKLFEEWQSPHEPQSKRTQRSVCPACLGILDCSFLSESLEAVCDAVSSSGCVFEQFLMTIGVPPVTLLRHRHVFLLLKKNFTEYKATEGELVTVKDCTKFVLGTLFEKAFPSSVYAPASSFQISLQLRGSLDPAEKEAIGRLSKPPKAGFKKAKRPEEFSIKTVTSFLDSVSSDDFLREFRELPSNATAPEPAVVGCSHQQIYFAGRYCKFSRELSQTPWLIDGERKMKDSVEELIANVVRKFVDCERMTFSSSGREDVDVRMLGDGRPFVLEVWSPKRIVWPFEETTRIQEAVNASTEDVSINRFQLVARESIKDLKAGEENKQKHYCAYCVSEQDTGTVDFAKLKVVLPLELKQRTPMRVLHRRAVMTRNRRIHEASVEIQDAHHFTLRMTTQAGTYVKEFVHGDFGRTLPNVKDILGANVDIEALDVLKVDLDWPPEIPVGDGAAC